MTESEMIDYGDSDEILFSSHGDSFILLYAHLFHLPTKTFFFKHVYLVHICVTHK